MTGRTTNCGTFPDLHTLLALQRGKEELQWLRSCAFVHNGAVSVRSGSWL